MLGSPTRPRSQDRDPAEVDDHVGLAPPGHGGGAGDGVVAETNQAAKRVHHQTGVSGPQASLDVEHQARYAEGGEVEPGQRDDRAWG
jgi:hypothetical protein